MISPLIIILNRPGVSGVYSIYRIGTHYLSHYLLSKSLKHYSVFLVELTYIIMPKNSISYILNEQGPFYTNMYHKPWAHLPGWKMAKLPRKWHICKVMFDTSAQKMAHLQGSKRAHLPGRIFCLFKKCLKEKKRPKKCQKVPEIINRVKRGGT